MARRAGRTKSEAVRAGRTSRQLIPQIEGRVAARTAAGASSHRVGTTKDNGERDLRDESVAQARWYKGLTIRPH